MHEKLIKVSFIGLLLRGIFTMTSYHATGAELGEQLTAKVVDQSELQIDYVK